MKERLFNIIPFLVLGIGLIATLVVWQNTQNAYNMLLANRFESKVNQFDNALKDRLATYADAHYAAAGMFLSTDNVSGKDWKVFVQSLNLDKRYPGINGLGFAETVLKTDLAEYVNKIRQKYIRDYTVKYHYFNNSDTLFLIKFLEPKQRNAAAIGFDMASEPNRKEAMLLARNTGKPTITKKVILVQDTTRSPGFLMYVPVFKDGEMPDEDSVYKRIFVGWVYAPFIVKDFVDGVLKLGSYEIRNELVFDIYDGEEISEDNLIYRETDNSGETIESDLKIVRTIPAFNQKWKLSAMPTKSFLKRYNNNQNVILIGGLLLSASLFFIAYLMAKTRSNALSLANEMTQAIRQKNEELNNKNLELERSNTDLEQFAYVASHDLKEPLRMVKIYMQLLKDRYKQKLDDDAKTFIEYATEGAERMDRLISDLLNYSRVGRKGTEFTNVDVNEVIKEVIKSNDAQIEEASARIVYASLPVVFANDNYLFRLFQNLINNSIKFKSDKPLLISITAESKNGFWFFSVKDNGIGIEQQHLNRIFVIFQRLHGREEYPGTGIGLAICKKIVEFHGGKIWAESKVGQGTSIKFTLPEN